MKPCPVRDVALRPDGTVTFRGVPVFRVEEGDGTTLKRFEDGTLVLTTGPLSDRIGVEVIEACAERAVRR